MIEKDDLNKTQKFSEQLVCGSASGFVIGGAFQTKKKNIALENAP